jgi:hypothetical protein
MSGKSHRKRACGLSYHYIVPKVDEKMVFARSCELRGLGIFL